MMSDLISKGELFNKLATVQTLGEAYGVIQGMDTVDAVPVRKGQWIYEERNGLDDETDDGRVYRIDKWWTCSECGHAKGFRKPDDKYCPNCGAKMDGDGSVLS